MFYLPVNGMTQFIIEQVVGVPVTLNGDLKNQFVETTVGFDTICKVALHYYAGAPFTFTVLPLPLYDA
jgi:6-phosphofructokinase